jgi:hypothetical protein
VESITINHAQIISSTINAKRAGSDVEPEPIQNFTSADPSAKASPQVIISPLAQTLSDLNLKSRFTSLEEFSEHSTKLFSQLLTTEEIQSGTRRPFASAEDERLSHLTLKELMEEGNKLPLVDASGHSAASIYGNEQTDRINIAIGNILLTSQINQRDVASKVEASVSAFKSNAEEKLKIASQRYDIVFKDGKATTVGKISSTGKPANAEELKKIQNLLDHPDDALTKSLLSDIDQYNQTSWQVIDNELTQHIYGAEQDRYLQKNVSVAWLLEGTNYSNVSSSNNLYDKYVELAAFARIKYQAALDDGSHFANSRTDPGIQEATRIRASVNTQV